MATNEKREVKRGIWSRRDFFGRLGWAGFGVFSLVSLFGFMRSAFPRVLFKPPTTFKAGYPSDYTVGEVSEKFKKDFRVWIVREEVGFYAVFAKCTHLGCTPRWLAAESKFKCPLPRQRFLQVGAELRGAGPTAAGPVRDRSGGGWPTHRRQGQGIPDGADRGAR